MKYTYHRRERNGKIQRLSNAVLGSQVVVSAGGSTALASIPGRVIHQSPDVSNHRTPSKYRTEIQVIPTSIQAESAFTAARNAHLLHQLRASITARDKPAILLTSSSRCFFQALRSANPSLQYVHVFGSKSR